MPRLRAFMLWCLALGGISLTTAATATTTLPGHYTTTWFGNTWGGGKKWVQNWVERAVVKEDGTIHTWSGWDEAGRPTGMYKDGDIAGQRSLHVDPTTVTDKNGVTWTIENLWGAYILDKHDAPIPAGKTPYIKGSNGLTITDCADPTALAIDNRGRLLVADNGLNQNIRIYDNLATKPTLVATFGKPGGIFADPPGVVEDKKFCGITGVGVDQQNSIYVINNGFALSGTDIRAFSRTGRPMWRLLGLQFVDSGDFDPATDGLDIYTRHEHFVMDYAKRTGEQWQYYGYTLHPFKYPDDPRLHLSLESAFVRRINGQKFLYLTDMYAQFLAVYRFDGEIAVPCAFFCVSWDGQWDKFPYLADRRPKFEPWGTQRWMWRDANGDGQVQATEFDTYDIGYMHTKGLCVDSRGDIWFAARSVHHFAMQGLDKFGAPIYDTKHYSAEPAPADAALQDISRLIYLPDQDVMYLAGGSNFPDYEKVIRYDNWSGKRTTRWRLQLPLDLSHGDNWEANTIPESMAVAGDYLFVVFGSTGPSKDVPGVAKRGEISVYRLSDAAFVGTITPGPEVYKESGCIDMPYAINAMVRKNGEYLICVEEDWKGKNILYRWNPTATEPYPSYVVPQNIVNGKLVPLPDVIVTDLTWSPASPKPGDAVTFTATVKNIGKAATPKDTILGVQFKVGEVITWSDTHATPLAPEASVTLTANGGDVSAVWQAVAGTYPVTATVDDVNRMEEMEETNNSLKREVTVKP